ncbi:deaminase-reductase domain-containing protein [Nostoc commune NIES-4072]|uniref:Deaminase-reductase domain-containing protein n=1 Tax=Nostoc commune NIES-4072 TaxID=2005467 RepID=A0A2R5FJQ5_NOSCO|nr:RibD family protein [Nostoc commune]BBD64987.1 deaminase-reductase domain-containing protein [Nostoc commune HK-02]GBG17688.1 deaminase-reductase domain-containing protein [Nostoc commune NIES-4072]
MLQHRPHTTVVLAMSADGKIGDFRRSPARFGSRVDKAHLEKQIAACDAVLFGAGTLRAYGTTLTISDPTLVQLRAQEGKSPQPVHIVTTHSANFHPEIKFFKQPVRRWLLTTTTGAASWKERLRTLPSMGTRSKECPPKFEQILVFETPTREIDISAALKYLATLHITRLAVLGGGELVASLLRLNLIDELWLTVCPLILGGNTAPTPVDGKGFLPDLAPKLQLLEVHTVEQEVFLHYRLQQPAD